MEEFYLEIRAVHIGAAFASGTVFALRGLGRLMGARWPMAWPLRLVSYAVDTTLLTAALMLMTIVHQYPFVDAWLTTKLLLLIAYIGLAYCALRDSDVRRRAALYLAALLVYGFIITVARAHDPLGVFA